MNTPTPPEQQPRPASESRPGAQRLAEVVRLLSDAARAGGDFAEFVSLAVAGAAANAGGIEEVLAGRPGSWEADHVRQVLCSTVGPDEQHLWAHRTEPVLVRVHVDDVLCHLGYADLYDLDTDEELRRREQHIRPDDQQGPVTVEEEAAFDRLSALAGRVDRLREQEWAGYGRAFAENAHRAAAVLLPGLPVPVRVVVELGWQNNLGSGADRSGPAHLLWQHAVGRTPLPGSGIPPKDYPAGTGIAQAERHAGRLPLNRVERTGGPA